MKPALSGHQSLCAWFCFLFYFTLNWRKSFSKLLVKKHSKTLPEIILSNRRSLLEWEFYHKGESDETMHRVIDWLPSCWRHINGYIESYNSADVTLGKFVCCSFLPYHFLCFLGYFCGICIRLDLQHLPHKVAALPTFWSASIFKVLVCLPTVPWSPLVSGSEICGTSASYHTSFPLWSKVNAKWVWTDGWIPFLGLKKRKLEYFSFDGRLGVF